MSDGVNDLKGYLAVVGGRFIGLWCLGWRWSCLCWRFSQYLTREVMVIRTGEKIFQQLPICVKCRYKIVIMSTHACTVLLLLAHPWKWANSVARLKIPRSAENCGPYLSAIPQKFCY